MAGFLSTWLLKWKTVALLALAVGVTGGISAATPARAADRAVADADLAAWVDQRIETWRIKPAERPFDAIGWATDVRHALRLAQEHGRPLFLLTLDGRMDIGRC